MRATTNTVLALNDLIRIPVQICKATESTDVKLDSAGPSGAALKQVYIDTATGETIAHADILKGIRTGDEFTAIDADSLKAIDEQTRIDEMAVAGQMPVADIPFDRITGMHFLQSPTKGGSHKAYRLVYEALLADERAIVTKWTARSRQQLAVIYASERHGCLVLNTLTFAANLREPDGAILAPQQAEVSDEQVDMARVLLDAMPAGHEALEAETDEALALKRELVDRALAGEAIKAPAIKTKAQAEGDLTALLAASIKPKGKRKPAPKTTKKAVKA